MRFLGKSKNGSWIHKIHTFSEFFGSNPNSNFWDSQSSQSGHFFGKGFEKGIFDTRFSQQKWYTVVWHSHWTYVGGALTLSQSLHFISCSSSIYIRRLFLNPRLSSFLYVCVCVWLRRFMFKVIKKKTKTKTKNTASVLNSYNFTMLRCIPFEKGLCFKPK